VCSVATAIVGKVSDSASCSCCSIVADLGRQGAVFPIGEFWTINSRINHQRPALVVQSKRHCERLCDLNAAEHDELGHVLSLATSMFEARKGVERVYVQMWNEGVPGHVHFHLIPRCTSDETGPIGPNLEDRKIEELVSDLTELAADISAASTSSRSETSSLVRGALGLCAAWTRISLYRLFVVIRNGSKGLDAAETYVLFWLALWGVTLGLSSLGYSSNTQAPTAVTASLLILAVYRFLDMSLFELRIILAPTPFKSVARGVVLRSLNLIEVMLIVAALLKLGSGFSITQAALEGFRAATVQTNFAHEHKFADAVLVMGSTVSLQLLAGGIAMLLSKVANKIGERDGSSTTAMRS
jgi:diadenosine tetraphosphate (Ap4A) HIT family hydrolase